MTINEGLQSITLNRYSKQKTLTKIHFKRTDDTLQDIWYLFLDISHTIILQILFFLKIAQYFMLRCFAGITFVQLNTYFCCYKRFDCIFLIINILYLEESIQYTYRYAVHLLKKNKLHKKAILN